MKVNKTIYVEYEILNQMIEDAKKENIPLSRFIENIYKAYRVAHKKTYKK